jgi:hypothetical protein
LSAIYKGKKGMNEKRDAFMQQLKAKMDERKNEINELEAKAE